MGHVRSKTRSLGQIVEKLCVTLDTRFWSDTSETWSECLPHTCLKTGYAGSKTRSLGKIVEKPCVRSSGHIFSLIIMKLGQNVYLDQISDEFEKVMSGQKLCH